ncbi:MAG TPA: efflux RND transporter periplasmic adaptor subunit [Anaerolineaceae bacterium]|nr:efflux RND transporter periplasmic adaptor subunit [Anaerolineaceae bacterium]HPN51172.1 efflux RND transporter periplasmic adaptor subunit [Anaerolineaceae bacterium]
MKILKVVAWVAVAVAAVVGIYYGVTYIQAQQQASQSNYQTVRVERSHIIASIGGTGVVRPSQSAFLSWQTSGSIASLPVKIDDLVQPGDLLASLDRTTLAQNIILAEADLVTARRNLKNLQESQVNRAQAELNLVQAQKNLEDAQKKRSYRNATTRGTKEQIDAARATYVLAKDEVERAQDMFDRVADNSPDDRARVVAESNLSAAIAKRDRALINLNYLTGASDTEEVDEAQAKLDLAQAQFNEAEREWNRLKDGPDPDDITAAEARIAAIQATLRLSSITAPFAGIITEVRSKTGDQVSPGTISFRIDDLSHLFVDVPISEIDINKIAVSQTVNFTFDAIPNKTFHGVVIQIARVPIQGQTSVNYNVTIEMTDADSSVRPGMTAAVNIIVDEIEDVLNVPNRSVRVRSGLRYVYMLKDNQPVAVQVELGVSSDTNSQILSGNLQEGDVIILNPPLDLTNITGGPSFMGGR